MVNRIIALMTVLPVMAGAQNFHWEAKIAPVNTNAYYKILLQPDVSSQMREGFPDMRIVDKDNVETPYLIFKDEARKGVDRFVSYQIVDKDYSYSHSYITVKNTIGNSIDHIVLEVNNADANRHVHLVGSYDGKEWFAVKDEYAVVNFNGYDKGVRKTTNLLRFEFPLTDYKFYRFEIGDWRWWWHDYKAPIFVARAGYIEPTYIPEECVQLPQPTLSQQNDARAKRSEVLINFPEGEYIDHLDLNISTADKDQTDYYRGASLYERIPRKGDSLHPYTDRFLGSTILSSLNSNELNLGGIRVKDLVLVINNEDDRPLNVQGAAGFQVKHYLVSRLSSGNEYRLHFGSDSVNAPVYDMKYFADKIPDSLAVITTLARTDIFQRPQEKKTAEAGSFFRSNTFIWVAIAVVILLLVFVSSRMLKEMKNR